ncbi:hypothetical protein [Streptomyces gilvosporeus]|nr:hypothetical protein [Streptomyces gilvosporeus]
MAGVGEELVLALGGCFEAVEHVVEALAEAGEFVVAHPDGTLPFGTANR